MIKWKKYVIGFCLGAGIAMAMCSTSAVAEEKTPEPYSSTNLPPPAIWQCIPKTTRCGLLFKGGDNALFEIPSNVKQHIIDNWIKSSGSIAL